MFESGFAQSICQLTFILQNINSYQLKNRLFNQMNLQNLKFRTFLLPTKENPYLLVVTPQPLPLATTDLSVCIDLPILDISYKWNNVI